MFLAHLSFFKLFCFFSVIFGCDGMHRHLFCRLVTVYTASVIPEQMLYSSFGFADAMGIVANQIAPFHCILVGRVGFVLFGKKLKYQSHSDISSVFRLNKVICSRVVIYICLYFVDTG